MCAPLLPVMAVAGAAMSAAGSITGGMAANAQGKYEAKLAKRNSAAEIEAARESLIQGQSERRQFWRDISQTKGQNIAAMAANGIDVDFGSGARLQDDTQMLANEDAANLYANQKNRTQGFVVNAGNYVEQAKAARAKGKAALVGGIIQGASSLMSAASQYKSISAKQGR